MPPSLAFGPHFAEGILTFHPPRMRTNPPGTNGFYEVRVPKSDRDGNDTGTLLPVEVAVPLATYTGWNLRRRDAGAEGMLVSLAGSYIPFARTKEERMCGGRGVARSHCAHPASKFQLGMRGRQVQVALQTQVFGN